MDDPPARLAARLLRWRETAVRALLRRLPVPALFFVDGAGPRLALTFDDGPHPEVTPRLLDVLARHQARATFFLIGERVDRHPEVVARIAAEGHELGNHLVRDEPSIRLGDAELRRQLAGVNRMLQVHGPVVWWRPGSGWVTHRMARSASRAGLRCVLGTAVVTRYGPDGERTARRLLRRLHPGSVVVLHEGTGERRDVVAVTDRLLHGLRKRGLDPVTVSELVAWHAAPEQPTRRRGGTA